MRIFPWKFRILLSILLAGGLVLAGYIFYNARFRTYGIYITGEGDTITIFEWKTPNSGDDAVITQKSIDGLLIGKKRVEDLGSYYPNLEVPRFQIESDIKRGSTNVLPHVQTGSKVRPCNGWFTASGDPITIPNFGAVWRLKTGQFLLFHGDDLSILDGSPTNKKVLSTVARNLSRPREVCSVFEASAETFIVYSRKVKPEKAYDELGSFAELVKINDGKLVVVQTWETEKSVDSPQLMVKDESIYCITADGKSLEQRGLKDGRIVSSSLLPASTDVGWDGSPYSFTANGTVLELSVNSKTSKKWFSVEDLVELQIPNINGAMKIVYFDYNKSTAWIYGYDSQELLIYSCQQGTIDLRVPIGFPVFRFALSSDRNSLIFMGVGQEDRWKVISLDGTVVGERKNGLAQSDAKM